jgi:mannose-6-phosphate isomerase
MTIVALDGVIRRYEWGSTTAIPQLLDREPDGRPAAELWFGAHPDDPSGVPEHGATLDDVIGADPGGALGGAVVAHYGERLPFLLQVHPTAEQAQAGFAAEDAAGVARDAPGRNYRDPHHKPELICALSEFEALCGFRAPADTMALLDTLDVPELAFLHDALGQPDPLRTAFTAVLTHEQPMPVVRALVRRAGTASGGPLRAVRLAAEHFPDDVGVLLVLLLNYVRLQPGEAIYLGAGNVHAYLRGTGIEIMASSDNVLRCGLTGKHVDVAELLKITDFAVLAEPKLAAVGGVFDVPVPDFRLTRLELRSGEPMALDDPGPCIVLCASGSVAVGDVALRPGSAAFVGAGTATAISGDGLVFVAGVGRP